MIRSRATRTIVGGSLLGLPAALLAHALVFGGEHAAGGGTHALLFGLAAAFGFVATLFAAVAAARKFHVVAPRSICIAPGAALWFAGIEISEHTHTVPVALSALAILSASLIVRAVLYAFTHTVAAVAAALLCTTTKRRGLRVPAFARELPRRISPAYRFRVFSRPPPVFS